MTLNERPLQSNPVVGDAAPRFSLVANCGKTDERIIPCRRAVTLLGRRPGCKVVMQHRRVAPVHVAIVNDGHELTAVDLITPHGTLLNGLKMEHERLSDGDVLTCYSWEFRVDIEEASHSGDSDSPPLGLEPAPRVVALEHVGTGRLLQPKRDVCIIGRCNGCDITISENRVSRAHALLLSYFGRPAVFDLISTNQTFINERPVQFQLLDNNDVISVGESSFRVRLTGSPPVRPPAALRIATDPAMEPVSDERSGDMIDIKAAEASQRWRIAEKLEKAARKR